MEPIESTNDFIDFPAKSEIVERLRAIDDSSEQLDHLYETIGERLASKTYERSASAFILIEIIYDFEEEHGGDMSYLLPRYVLSLTGDRDLALSALGAFNEIKEAIQLQPPEEAGEEPEPEEEEEPARDREATRPMPKVEPPPTGPEPATTAAEDREGDEMMSTLQLAQKALSDLGLSTRVSIDLALRRPNRERVSRTLQDINLLRTALRRFEELLSRAELRVLGAAGVFSHEDEQGSDR